MFGRIIGYDYKRENKNHVILTDKGFKITFKIEEKYVCYLRKESENVVYYEKRHGPSTTFLNKNLEDISICTASRNYYKITPFNIMSEIPKTEFKLIYFRMEGEDEDNILFRYEWDFKLPKAEIRVELVS